MSPQEPNQNPQAYNGTGNQPMTNSNPQPNPVPGASQPLSSQPATFQIPRTQEPNQTATPPSSVSPPQSPVGMPQQPPAAPSSQPIPVPATKPNRSTQPPRHEPPIFMQEDSDIPPPFTKSGTASSVPGGVPDLRPTTPQSTGRQTASSQFQQPSAAPPRPPAGTPQRPPSPPMQKPIPPATNQAPVAKSSGLNRSLMTYIIGGLLALLLAGVLIWLVLGIFGGDDSDPADVSELRTYQSEQLGFSTSYPDGWTHEQGRRDGLNLVEFAHPELRDNGTAIAETVVIRLEEEQIDSIDDASMFFEVYQDAIASGFDGYSEIATQELTIDELTSLRVDADVVNDDYNDRVIMHFIYAESDAFIVISSVENQSFDDLRDDLDIFIANFQSQLTSQSGEDS